MSEEPLSIGEVARRTSIGVHTLRLYERRGLLATTPRRDSGGRRTYTDADLAWLTTCRLFRATRMPLTVIARFAELVRDGPGNEAERLRLLWEHRDRIEAQQAELDAARVLIDAKIRTYEEHLADGTAATLWIDTRNDVPVNRTSRVTTREA